MLQYRLSRVVTISLMNLAAIAKSAQSILPARWVLPARLYFLKVRSLLYRGSAVQCPCCDGEYSRFLKVGSPPRPAACPGCDSRERQRLLYLYLHERTNLFKARLRVLHIAPEDCLQSQLSRCADLDYTSADLLSSTAMLRMDITNIQCPDASFDAILCSHVLEHVNDDRRALRELHRVLRPGGWAILQVPVDPSRDHTFEDPLVTDARDRERLFGQWDHVRVYGRDYPDRLHAVGFDVRVVSFAAELPNELVAKCGLDGREEIYHCVKSQK